MFRIEGLNPCADCGGDVYPNVEYSKRCISFICPCCGGESHTPTSQGVEQAIYDWNRWHTAWGKGT